jgi:hypothetical protein
MEVVGGGHDCPLAVKDMVPTECGNGPQPCDECQPVVQHMLAILQCQQPDH